VIPHRLRSLSLGNKLAALFFSITAIVFATIWFYVVPQLQSTLEQQKLEDVRRLAHSSSDALARAEGRDISSKDLDELVRAVSDATGARVTLLGVQRSTRKPGRPVQVYVISDSRAQAALSQTYELAQRAARTGKSQAGYGHEGGNKVVQASRPLYYRGRADWVAQYSRSLDGVAETVGLVQRRLVVAGLAAVLLALAGAYLVAQTLGRRVRRLERAAEQLAAGHFIEPLPIDSEDELGQLTRAFNEMQAQLSRVDRARKEFVANASHELRTPLFSLGGFLELLEDDPGSESRVELIAAVRGQLDRLQKLAVDLLDLSRLDAGSMDLEQERVDLAELTRTVLGEFAPLHRRGDAQIDLRLPGGRVDAQADRERVAQIVRILVDNAIRHTPDGTRVTVSAARRNGTAKVTVADTGLGLDDSIAPQVFDRFFTGDSAGGAGLGLAIARELAERMDGEIRLKSRPGRTAFTLELPSDEDQA
jgi:signal transduction histidine kinase